MLGNIFCSCEWMKLSTCLIFFSGRYKQLPGETCKVEVAAGDDVLNAQGWGHGSRVPLLMTAVACVSALPRAAEIVIIFGCSLSLRGYLALVSTTEQMLIYCNVP